MTATDLPERLLLIEKNLERNKEVIKLGEGQMQVEELNWNSKIDRPLIYDFVILVDCIYYLKVFICDFLL